MVFDLTVYFSCNIKSQIGYVFFFVFLYFVSWNIMFNFWSKKKLTFDILVSGVMPSSFCKKKFYAVAVGRKTGVFESWDECSRHVTGFPNARFKSFSTWEEAQAFVAEGSERNTIKPGTVSHVVSAASGVVGGSDRHQVVAAAAAAIVGKGVRSLLLPSSPLLVSSLSSSRASVQGPEDDGWETSLLRHVSREWLDARLGEAVEVYVDGSCRSNGKGRQARGGYGGYYAANDERNFSCPLPVHEPQTNNRAELYAVIHVLRTALEAEPCYNIRIFSDSRYTILGADNYLQKWLRNDFCGSNGSVVANRDLWTTLGSMRSMHAKRYAKRLLAQFDLRPAVAAMAARCLALSLIYVKGHSGVHGNEMADSLAVMGALSGGKSTDIK